MKFLDRELERYEWDKKLRSRTLSLWENEKKNEVIKWLESISEYCEKRGLKLKVEEQSEHRNIACSFPVELTRNFIPDVGNGYTTGPSLHLHYSNTGVFEVIISPEESNEQLCKIESLRVFYTRNCAEITKKRVYFWFRVLLAYRRVEGLSYPASAKDRLLILSFRVRDHFKARMFKKSRNDFFIVAFVSTFSALLGALVGILIG
ncbi:hypothetical protein [Salinivibrio kushneri]|uniref:hypothetical protein n=1 Tax=Salinivibrio kushneri TaxID=1908198 RepID=UPI0022B4FE46|nr:hypothetical protein [Salinivibrio kushneri]WBA12869.1 hypothetical protein O4546_06625 [Salinivibrio kushneri]